MHNNGASDIKDGGLYSSASNVVLDLDKNPENDAKDNAQLDPNKESKNNPADSNTRPSPHPPQPLSNGPRNHSIRPFAHRPPPHLDLTPEPTNRAKPIVDLTPNNVHNEIPIGGAQIWLEPGAYLPAQCIDWLLEEPARLGPIDGQGEASGSRLLDEGCQRCSGRWSGRLLADQALGVPALTLGWLSENCAADVAAQGALS